MRLSFKDTELLYSATTRCTCGAGLAYPHRDHGWQTHDGTWVCSAVLRGEHDTDDAGGPAGNPFAPASGKPHVVLPWRFYEIKDESQPSAGGATTRPPGTKLVQWAEMWCKKCGTTWDGPEYVGEPPPHSVTSPPCPTCGARWVDDRSVITGDVERRGRHEGR